MNTLGTTVTLVHAPRIDYVHTIYVPLAHDFTEHRQITPNLENKYFSVKSTQYMHLKSRKEPDKMHFGLTNEVCSS